jgi:charged multivesicular body protein 6
MCININYYFSLQKLKKQRDQLQKYQKRIEAVLEKDRQMAKKLLSEGKKE